MSYLVTIRTAGCPPIALPVIGDLDAYLESIYEEHGACGVTVKPL